MITMTGQRTLSERQVGEFFERQAARLCFVPHPTPEEWSEIDRALNRAEGEGQRMLAERLAEPPPADVVGLRFQVTPPESEADLTDEGPVPSPTAPVEELVAFWRHRSQWTASPVRYAQAVAVLDRLKIPGAHVLGPALLAEPERVDTPAPSTATVKIRRILDRDLAGDLQRVVEWSVDLPLRADGQPDLSKLPPEPPASR
jgi:hypothetical protein